jgi:eukaryotic-like serine/threonine-protein kinase
MGEVYRARDTRLDRIVAIKILPSEFAANAQMRLRFEREAKAISSLAHPHICTVHDVGSASGIDYLVMEHLEGETVADRLARGAMSPEEVIRHGIEIADALEKAHRSGIVHRDLKPSNVMLTRTGAKLLDFGLAKPQHAVIGPDAPTEQKPLTEEGAIVGTFQYMAPEQLEGRAVDARTDIFSLGAVLYEMATGRRAFTGTSRASLIASILATEPPAVSDVQPLTPRPLDRIIRHCLAKDPDERWQSAHDVKLELKAALEPPVSTPAQRPRGRAAAGWITAAVLAIVAAAASWQAYRATSKPAELRRMALAPPPNTTFNVADAPVTISPDGRRFLVLLEADPQWHLALRDADNFDLTHFNLEGYDTFWSPDGRQIGYFESAKMSRMDVTGGARRTIAAVGDSRGGSWGADDTIVYAPAATGPLMKVSLRGGAPVAVTKLDTAANQTGHWRPFFLPDGKHFLYLARSSKPDNAGVYAGSVDGMPARRILDIETTPVYSDGYLIYADRDDLYAVAFDPERIETSGDPLLVTKNIFLGRTYYSAGYTAAAGTLAYHPRVATLNGALARLTRANREQNDVSDAVGRNLDLSRDGSRLALERVDADSHTADIWIFDFARGTSTRLSTDSAPDTGPVWSPDSRWIVWTSMRGNQLMILRRLANGGGAEETITALTPEMLTKLRAFSVEVVDWSRDGRYLLAELGTADKRGDLVVFDLTKKNPIPEPAVSTPSHEQSGRFSSDGRWIAYSAFESGSEHVYVQPFPPTGARWQASTDNGTAPRWRSDGRELFFTRRDRSLMAVSVERVGPDLALGTPALVAQNSSDDYVVSLDGQTFHFARADRPQGTPIHVVTNWTAALK